MSQLSFVASVFINCLNCLSVDTVTIPFSHQPSQSLNLFLLAAELQSGFLHVYGSGSRSGSVLVFPACWESLQRIVNLLCEICSSIPGYKGLHAHPTWMLALSVIANLSGL